MGSKLGQIINSDLCKAIRPMYIFTVLAFLFAACLWTITHADLKGEVDTILVTASGGLLSLLGVVVNYEFGSAKPRDPFKTPAGTTVDSTTTISTSTANQETKQ